MLHALLPQSEPMASPQVEHLLPIEHLEHCFLGQSHQSRATGVRSDSLQLMIGNPIAGSCQEIMRDRS